MACYIFSVGAIAMNVTTTKVVGFVRWMEWVRTSNLAIYFIFHQDEEAAGSHSGSDQPCNARTRRCQIGEIDSCGTVSAKSSDSNQSDGSSTGSFSFPV